MKQGKVIGAGVVSAIAASLCCITPILGLIAGTSGMASTFSWIAPARPYLIGITAAVLIFAWYQKLKPVKVQTDDCGCEVKKTSFMQSKLFLGIVTGFSIIMLSFPAYAHIFYPKQKNQTIVADSKNIQTVEFKISGMTCASCEEHVKQAVNKLKGIVDTKVSYDDSNAIIQFDKTQSTIQQIEEAINSTGYKSIQTIIKQ